MGYLSRSEVLGDIGDLEVVDVALGEVEDGPGW